MGRVGMISHQGVLTWREGMFGGGLEKRLQSGSHRACTRNISSPGLNFTWETLESLKDF